ncbi:MAG: 4-(cytidine 5'-diphospho)-2-C-methyl-D-erythritol kinase [Chthoniobacterales bacterium]|nr:4-(cytidine 5'-diphospho)-2-C-methyl-D-erythritol kinase [Chthoniobacterales bacterium]
MELRAPAKINLSFRILRRREDSFHEIETLMAPLSLADEITLQRLEASGSVEFSCDDPTVPAGDDNLVVRAARAFFAATGRGEGVRIELRKRIPHGAGLGGGSSDAATVLLGLHRLFEPKLPREKLVELAAALGSDVPFFLYESVAFCRGRGELVEPVPAFPALPLLLLKPPFGVPTPWAYSRWRDSQELSGIRYTPQQWEGLTFANDLERPVFEKHLFLAHMKTWLLAQPEIAVALMSGSGSTMFAVLRDKAAAEAVGARARVELDPEIWTCACETRAGTPPPSTGRG